MPKFETIIYLGRYDHQINSANSANAKGSCSLLILDPTFSRPEVGDPV